MFTGLTQGLGLVAACEASAPSWVRLRVTLPEGMVLAVGESVAVDGCCLTALHQGSILVADLSPETLARTALGGRRAGDHVNLERALRAGDALGGHLVQGHVDATTRVLAVSRAGDGASLRLEIPEGDAAFLSPKGSVCVQGVSLTVADLGPSWFEMALVPHTLRVTTLGELVAGSEVNVEYDATGKQVLRALALSGRVELDAGALRRLGVEGSRSPIQRVASGAPWEAQVGYCRAVRAGALIHVSGSAPLNPDGTTHAPGDARAQARRCFAILREAVRRLGGEAAVITRTRLFVTDIERWREIGEAHAEAFGQAPPATTMVEVRRLIRADMLVEAEADAFIPGPDGLESRA
jgi:riboflavin synthase alpha subunit